MKTRYIVSLIGLAVLFAVFLASLAWGPLGSYTWLSSAMQGTAVFVALTASVIALHASDRKLRYAKGTITVSLDPDERRVHKKSQIHRSIENGFASHPDTFTDDRVQFHIRNNSGFTLRDPTLTFRLPLDRQHPHRHTDGNWVVTFNSNLYNSQEDLRILQFGDTAVISNRNLPYWNKDEHFTIWIRMVLDYPNEEPFDISVSLNSENAEGTTVSVPVDQARLRSE